MIYIEKAKLPNEAKEGDVLNILDGKVTIDYEEAAKRKVEIKNLTKDLWEKLKYLDGGENENT